MFRFMSIFRQSLQKELIWPENFNLIEIPESIKLKPTLQPLEAFSQPVVALPGPLLTLLGLYKHSRGLFNNLKALKGQ